MIINKFVLWLPKACKLTIVCCCFFYKVPVSETDDTQSTDTNILTNVTNATSTPSQSYDPGGCDISLHPKLSDTVNVVRYATLVISALFFVEVCIVGEKYIPKKPDKNQMLPLPLAIVANFWKCTLWPHIL